MVVAENRFQEYMDKALKQTDIENRKGINGQHIIAFGPGALISWDLSRKLFSTMVEEIRTANWKKPSLVSFRWLGYFEPDRPYFVYETILPITRTHVGITRLVSRSGCSSIDLVCHSLMGVVVAYWAAVAPLELVEKVRYIITINSPIAGAQEYYEYFNRFKRCKEKKGQSLENFKPEELLPELKPGSPIMNAIRRSESRLADRLIAIRTEGDEIAPLEKATLPFVKTTITVSLEAASDDVHRDAIFDKGVVDKVKKILTRQKKALRCKM